MILLDLLGLSVAICPATLESFRRGWQSWHLKQCLGRATDWARANKRGLNAEKEETPSEVSGHSDVSDWQGLAEPSPPAPALPTPAGICTCTWAAFLRKRASALHQRAVSCYSGPPFRLKPLLKLWSKKACILPRELRNLSNKNSTSF